ncbi:MAG: chemotaxis protein CheD [Pseudomonadota bacterium]
MRRKSLVITQGEYATGGDPEVSISTLLGSCVACCYWDPIARVGGMNHILLAARTRQAAHCDQAGVNAMELLINALLKKGALRGRLQAKLFGGAQMISGLSDIGATNCAFALDYLERENIPCISQSLGGDKARHLIFWPSTGSVKLKIQHGTFPPVKEAVETGNALELF